MEVQGHKEYEIMPKKGLYANINKRKKAGTSRSKAKSTIKPSVYKAMKNKTGSFKPKKKK